MMKPWEEYRQQQGVVLKPWEEYQNQALQPMTEEQKAQAEALRNREYPQTSNWDVAQAGLEGLGEGLLSGAERFANGYTLGGYDWLADKLGLNATGRAKRLQERAENANLGGLNSVGNIAAEFSGGMRGLGNLVYNGSKAATGFAGKAVPEVLKRYKFFNKLPAAVGAGTIASGINSAFRNNFSNWDDIGDDTAIGAAVSTALYPIFYGGAAAANRFSPKGLTSGKKGGLENVIDNPESIRIVNSGIKQSDDVANELLIKAPQAARSINAETGNMVNSSLNRRVDVPKTIATQKAKYNQFMKEHAADEVLDFAPTREQLISYKPDSNFNPNKNLTKESAEKLLRDRANQQNLSIFNDDLSKTGGKELGVNHFLASNRRPYIRTLNNTLNKPDIRYTQNGREYAAKKYSNNETGKDFFDLTITEDGKLFNKLPTNDAYMANQLNKTTQDLSLSGKLSNTFEGNNPMLDTNIITPQKVVVNRELPNISSLYDDLTLYQAKALERAVKRGLSKTNQKAGSLESVNEIKKELNTMIDKSYIQDPNNRMGSKATSETSSLLPIKLKFDKVLGSAAKGRDRGYRKAKRMEEAYNLGRRYNPNGVNNDDLIPSLTPLENNAFAQGLFTKMVQNPLPKTNMAQKALDYENVLAGVLPTSSYNSLMEGLNRQAMRFNKLSNLRRYAENQFLPQESNRHIGWQQLIGTGLDKLNSTFRGNAIRKAALDLMNPEFVGNKQSWLAETYPYLSTYLNGSGYRFNPNFSQLNEVIEKKDK